LIDAVMSSACAEVVVDLRSSTAWLHDPPYAEAHVKLLPRVGRHAKREGFLASSGMMLSLFLRSTLTTGLKRFNDQAMHQAD